MICPIQWYVLASNILIAEPQQGPFLSLCVCVCTCFYLRIYVLVECARWDNSHHTPQPQVISVTRIKALRLEKFLSIDPQTMASLSIFQQDAHPSLSGCGPAKEGLSLFSLLNNTKSPLGKSLLRMWFMRPLLDEVEIFERLKAVRFFTRPDCLDLVGTLRSVSSYDTVA